MATNFIETPDATQDNKFWSSQAGTVAYDSTTATKSGVASWKIGAVGAQVNELAKDSVVADSGTRISVYVRISSLPSVGRSIILIGGGGEDIIKLQMQASGIMRIRDGNDVTIGTSGITLSINTWYRIALCYVITSAAVWQIKTYIDGVLDINLDSTATLGFTGSANFTISYSSEADKYLNVQHVYIDNGSDLTDPGDIRVTAKRPNANGTTNGFTTQIGAGGSGYGSGHSPQVNERALSVTNGWSMVGAGSAVTEEYAIENTSTGDVNIASKPLVDFVGWVYASSLVNETAQIKVAGSSSNISLTNTNTMFTKVAGSTTYPAGGTDIGIITSTDLTTVSLYEAGIMCAYRDGYGHLLSQHRNRLVQVAG